MNIEVGRICFIKEALATYGFIKNKLKLDEGQKVVVLPDGRYSNHIALKAEYDVSVGIISENLPLTKRNVIGEACILKAKYLKPTENMIFNYDVIDEKVLIWIGRSFGFINNEAGWFIDTFGRKEFIRRLQLAQGINNRSKTILKCRNCGRTVKTKLETVTANSAWRCKECEYIMVLSRATTRLNKDIEPIIL